MSVTVITAITTVVVTVLGTILTYISRNNDSVDRRLDMALKANHRLVEDYRAENDKLLARVSSLETSRERVERELIGVRETLSIQGIELFSLRQQNTNWQHWSADILAWCALAIGIISALGGTVPPPPPAPETSVPGV